MRKSRIIDIALQAGVSTATVDRVLNERPGVRRQTVEKVREAIQLLNSSNSRPKIIPTLADDIHIDAILAGSAGFANDVLARELRQAADELGISLTTDYPHRLNPTELTKALERSLERKTSGIVVQSLDHPLVRNIIEQASDAGVPVVSMLTGLPGSRSIGYVGLDNRAAGRTAGLMMGLLSSSPGDIALFSGTPLYRSHEEREIGFRTKLREDFKHLNLLPVLQSFDDPKRCYEMSLNLLQSNSSLKGILNIGGGNRGIERAILETEKQQDITYLCFNLTPLTKQALVAGIVDAVVHQDMGKAARMALGAIIDIQTSRPVEFSHVPIEIITRENV